MRVLGVIGLSLMLSGCLAAANQREAARQKAADDATCARLGAVPKSDRDFQCHLQLEVVRQNAAATADSIRDEANAAQLRAAGMGMIMGRRLN